MLGIIHINTISVYGYLTIDKEIMSIILTVATIRDIIFCEFLINLMTDISDIEDKKMEIKKVLAVVMSLCIVGGTLSCGAPVISQTITAQADAADACFSYDESSGVMYLSGEIDGSMIRAYGNKARVLEIIATEGTVLPKNCGYYHYKVTG